MRLDGGMVTTHASAISALLSPRPTSTMISRSLPVRSSNPRMARSSVMAGRTANSAIRRRVIEGSQQGLPLGKNTYGSDQLLGWDVLEQNPLAPAPQRGVHVVVSVEGGQNQGADIGQVRIYNDSRRSFDPVSHRHADVHQ